MPLLFRMSLIRFDFLFFFALSDNPFMPYWPRFFLCSLLSTVGYIGRLSQSFRIPGHFYIPTLLENVSDGAKT